MPLPLGRTVLGTTEAGGESLSAGCVDGEAPERVYFVDLAARSRVRAVLQSAAFDAVLYLREGCAHPDMEVACNDDYPKGDSTQARIDATLDPGRYYLIVDGTGDGYGEFEIFATVAPLESTAAVCEAARPLVVGTTVRGSTAGISDQFHTTCGRGAHAGEHVYRIDVAQPARLRVLQQTEYDGVLHLRSECDQPASEIACNDDFRGPNHSLLTARVAPGRYYLFADGFARSQQGTYALSAELGAIRDASEEGPLSARCEASRALPLQPGVTEFDTFQAVADQSGSCGGRDAPETLYSFRVKERSRLWARLRDAEFNAVLYLRRTCTDPGSEFACERQARVDRRRASEQRSAHGLNLLLDPGEYTLFIDGIGPGDFGAAQLELQLDPVRAVEAHCERAPLLVNGAVVSGDTSRGSGRRSWMRSSCGSEARSADDLYRIVVAKRSRVVVEIDTGFDAVLHLRKSCIDVASELACNDDSAHDRLSRIDSVVEPGEYFVVVDGFGAREAGPYTLRLGIRPQP